VRQMALQCFHCDSWVGLVKGQPTEMKSQRLVSEGQAEERKRLKTRVRNRAAGVVRMPSKTAAFLCGVGLAVTLLSHAGIVFPQLAWVDGNQALHPYISASWAFWIFSKMAGIGLLGTLSLASLALWEITLKLGAGGFQFWVFFLPALVVMWSSFSYGPKSFALDKKRVLTHPNAILLGLLVGLLLYVFIL
jgi:hypothetical protein